MRPVPRIDPLDGVCQESHPGTSAPKHRLHGLSKRTKLLGKSGAGCKNPNGRRQSSTTINGLSHHLSGSAYFSNSFSDDHLEWCELRICLNADK